MFHSEPGLTIFKAFVKVKTRRDEAFGQRNFKRQHFMINQEKVLNKKSIEYLGYSIDEFIDFSPELDE